MFGTSFSVYRVDRNSSNSNRSRGGGVLIAVSNALASCQIAVDRFTSIEAVWVKVSLPTRNAFIGALYIPPDGRNDSGIIQQHLDAIEYASSLTDLVDVLLLLGDFNQPGLIWLQSGHRYAFPDPDNSTTTPASRLLIDGTAFFGLSQISLISNFQNHFLDLVFVSENLLPDCAVDEAPDAIVPLDNYHPALVISIANSDLVRFDDSSNADCLNFRKTDFELLRRKLSLFDWNALNDLDIDTAVGRFNCFLSDCVFASVPKRQPPRKPPWTNATLRNLKRERARTLRALTKRRCAITKRNFSIASNCYRRYNKHLYKQYVCRMQHNLRRHPKGFWSFVNTKRKENGLPSRVFLDNDVALNAEDKCNLFAKHFSTVFSNALPSQADIARAARDVPNNVISMDVLPLKLIWLSRR
ncbi:uncharacterized protein LOC134222662 [Armigeres subalbatus]|uniref:uncharacterized protein LOC134222662 n=1 Tax=Armigeres subalbatus TaxID=124917 RepID=UPI002ED5497A